MDFQDFLHCIPKLEREVLPAEAAHSMMMPPERKQIMKTLNLETKNPRKAAIMMLFYPKNKQTHFWWWLRFWNEMDDGLDARHFRVF